MKLKIQKIHPDAIIPNYAHKGDAGLDLYSAEEVMLEWSSRAVIKTGLKIEIPEGYVGLIWDKSGLALLQGIKTMAGVIDSGYRGEIKVVVANLNRDREDCVIRKGMKVAQMLIQKVENVEIEVVDELSQTRRGEKGFGSTS